MNKDLDKFWYTLRTQYPLCAALMQIIVLNLLGIQLPRLSLASFR